METVLLAVAVVALGVALVMSLAAWRLSRDARERSAARVAALAHASREPAAPLPVHTAVFEAAAEPVVGPETAERAAAPWTSGRVSPFTRATGERGSAAAARLSPPVPLFDTFQPEAAGPPEATAVSGAFLGTSVARSSGGGQRGLAIAAAVLFVTVSAVAYWTVYGTDASSAASVEAASSAPLELLSLRHERRGGRLAVTGLVRNPTGGSAVDRLAAVVFLFDQQGSFITSARAHVDFLRLAPGDESPFVVDVDAPSTVARYRVSFRTERGPLTHIDRRGQAPLATSDAR